MTGARTNTQPQLRPSPIPAFPDVQVFPKTRLDSTAAEFDLSSDYSDDEIELFDLDDVFNVDHDLFLVRNWCFQPEVPLEELTILFRREFGLERNAIDLERRMLTLQTDECIALLAVYLKAACIDQEATGSGYAGNMTSIKPQFHTLLRRLRPSCETKLLQLVYDDDKTHAEPSDMIPVDVSSRNFPKYSRLVHKRQLVRCCKVIRDLFHDTEHSSDVVFSQRQSFSLHGLKGGNEKLQLTDAVPFYDSCMVFNHLEQPIFDRLLNFAKDPHVMERLALQKQLHAEQKHIKREVTHQLQSIFSSQRKLQLDRLELARASECESITHRLERTLEEDILHLRRMHDSLLKHEHAKINAKFDEQIAKLNSHLNAMRNDVKELQQKCDNNNWNNLDQDIARSALHVERIFGTSDYILRLLILAEDVDAEPLRQSLIHYLGRENTFPQFALRREFTSKMISESTILAILKGVPTKDLREVEAAGKNFVYNDYVTREIHTRRITFTRFIAGLTNDQLQVVSRINSDGLQHVLDSSGEEFISSDMLADMKAVVDFPCALDREFVRRREFSSVRMNSAGVDHLVSFSEDDCVLHLEASHRYCSVLATNDRKQGESGRWMFEVTVEVFGGDGESILLGWEVPRFTSLDGNDTDTAPSFVPGLTPGADGRSYGVTWQSDGGLDMGMVHSNGQSKSGVPCIRAGDVVGCTISQDELVPYLRFYLNGVQVIPALAAAISSTGVACQNSVYCLFPVVSMFSSRKKPQMRVRFNFRGNFRFPIVGFEPYGAPL